RETRIARESSRTDDHRPERIPALLRARHGGSTDRSCRSLPSLRYGFAGATRLLRAAIRRVQVRSRSLRSSLGSTGTPTSTYSPTSRCKNRETYFLRPMDVPDLHSGAYSATTLTESARRHET